MSSSFHSLDRDARTGCVAPKALIEMWVNKATKVIETIYPKGYF